MSKIVIGKRNGAAAPCGARATAFVLLCFLLFVAGDALAANSTWTGEVSSDWNDAGNWSKNGVPGQKDGADIPASPSGGRFPVFSAGSAEVKDLTVDAGAILTLEGGRLTVTGKLSVDGRIIQTAGTLEVQDFNSAGRFDQTAGTLISTGKFSNMGRFISTGGLVEFAADRKNKTRFNAPGINQFHHVLITGFIVFDKADGANLSVSGDWFNIGTVSLKGKETVEFNGSAPQSVGGASASGFNRLVLNNTAAPVTWDPVVPMRGSVGGEGILEGDVVVASGEVLAPGLDKVKTLKIDGSLELEADAAYVVDLDDAESDRIDVSGDLKLGDMDRHPILDPGALHGDSWLIAAFDGTLEGIFMDTAGHTLHDGMELPLRPGYYIHYVVGETRRNYIVITDSPAPPGGSGAEVYAFRAAQGVVVEYLARNVRRQGPIALELLGGNGAAFWRGQVDAEVGPRYAARFLVPGLESGSRYDFAVCDETGWWWDAADVLVRDFAAEISPSTGKGIGLRFNSLPEHEYEVQWTAGLNGEWQAVTNVTGTGELTALTLPESGTNAAGGFYRIQLR